MQVPSWSNNRWIFFNNELAVDVLDKLNNGWGMLAISSITSRYVGYNIDAPTADILHLETFPLSSFSAMPL